MIYRDPESGLYLDDRRLVRPRRPIPIDQRFRRAAASQQVMLAQKISGGGGDPAFVTGQTVGTLRNNFSGQVGICINVVGSDIVVTELGRWVVSGNSGAHTVGIYTSSAGIGSPLGTVSVDASGASPGDYKYVTLGSPVTLTGGGIQYYWIFTTETSSGDQWYNDDTTVTTLATPSMVQSGYYFSGFNGSTVGGYAFGPVNFKFH